MPHYVIYVLLHRKMHGFVVYFDGFNSDSDHVQNSNQEHCISAAILTFINFFRWEIKDHSETKEISIKQALPKKRLFRTNSPAELNPNTVLMEKFEHLLFL